MAYVDGRAMSIMFFDIIYRRHGYAYSGILEAYVAIGLFRS
jgi:hypothetical protein